MKAYMNLVNGVPSGVLLDKKQANSFPVIFEERPNETVSTISESYFYELDGKSIIRKWNIRHKTQAEIDSIRQLPHWRDLPMIKEEAVKQRDKRNKLLAESDWVTVKAVDQNAADNLGIQVPQVWLDYRQALRDITTQDGFPHNVIWPEVQ